MPQAANTPKSGIYMDEIMSLYIQYFHEKQRNDLLAKEIEQINKRFWEVLNDKERHLQLLFNITDCDKAIENITILKQKGDFLLSAFMFVHSNTRDNKLKALLAKSIDVIQKLGIKFIEFEEVYNDLKNFNTPIDENSKEYKNKMNEIANYLVSKDKVSKASNSIRDLLDV